ncbi:UNVERIFIED_CONTAM: hypothetical protein FKN15_043434 [Acipenser sinensis]
MLKGPCIEDQRIPCSLGSPAHSALRCKVVEFPLNPEPSSYSQLMESEHKYLSVF